MHACLSLYTYLRVVKNKRIELGSRDWRLQAVCFGSVILLVPIFLGLDGFGALGYWCLSNARTTGGTFLSFVIFAVALLNAVATAGSNFFIASKLEDAMRSIRKLETRQSAAGTVLRKISSRQDGSTGGHGSPHQLTSGGSSSASAWQQAVQEQRALVASQCLTTLIRTASLVYIPLSISLFAVAVFQAAGYIEPLSSLAVVITANVSGFANSWAYMKNSMLKQSVKMISPPPNVAPSIKAREAQQQQQQQQGSGGYHDAL
ncbi:hypothetical protein BCR44DRAFT_1437885 [Catenaria anguillulae PL171]|uniref:G-protein coupled receptors family 2 profile 2 domain-containing protein n=1 Tax=Catenaria anguillulae PL171 TaxID=765915 RepID=A0A1Y2HGD8_9FUNG|nr:hypothetical protein BCR44DRAFT_1437885 [Catenaria anguillulae PL171]